IKNPRTSGKRPDELPALDPELKALAEHALDSQAAFEAFAAGVHKALPKVDRVCLTTFGNDMLRVEHSAYPGQVAQKVAETGFQNANGKAMALSGYALLNAFVINPDLKKARGLDLNMMGKTLTSSAHVPVAFEGRPATINFWSKEKD